MRVSGEVRYWGKEGGECRGLTRGRDNRGGRDNCGRGRGRRGNGLDAGDGGHGDDRGTRDCGWILGVGDAAEVACQAGEDEVGESHFRFIFIYF